MSGQEVFVVIKVGVYMQGIGGVFSDDEKAIDAAVKLANDEPDGYHRFKVIPARLDDVCALNEVEGPEVIATITRTDPRGWSRWSDPEELKLDRSQVRIVVDRAKPKA